jgi:hypothetical protein
MLVRKNEREVLCGCLGSPKLEAQLRLWNIPWGPVGTPLEALPLPCYLVSLYAFVVHSRKMGEEVEKRRPSLRGLEHSPAQ